MQSNRNPGWAYTGRYAALMKKGREKERERERERERRQDKTRQDYFIVRPPAHYNRSEHSGNSNSHGSNDGLKLTFLEFREREFRERESFERERERVYLHSVWGCGG